MTITLRYLELLSMDTLDNNCQLKGQTGTGMYGYNTRVSKTAKKIESDTLDINCQLKW